MYAFVTSSSMLIVCAVSTYVLGFLFRDQIYLRLLVFIGSSFYVTFYFVAGPEPLWDAMLGSVMIGTASLQGMLRLLWSRSEWSLPREDRHVRAEMGDIEPGLFRQLMKAGHSGILQKDTPLTREGEKPDALWFLVKGTLILDREGQPQTRLIGPCFVGDIAWLNRGTASATVTAEEGSEILRWSLSRLNRATRASHRLETALEALIAKDLARKLAKSTPIEMKYRPAQDGDAARAVPQERADPERPALSNP